MSVSHAISGKLMLKIIRCLSEIQFQRGLLYFYLQRLAVLVTRPVQSHREEKRTPLHPCLQPTSEEGMTCAFREGRKEW